MFCLHAVIVAWWIWLRISLLRITCADLLLFSSLIFTFRCHLQTRVMKKMSLFGRNVSFLHVNQYLRNILLEQVLSVVYWCINYPTVFKRIDIVDTNGAARGGGGQMANCPLRFIYLWSTWHCSFCLLGSNLHSHILITFSYVCIFLHFQVKNFSPIIFFLHIRSLPIGLKILVAPLLHTLKFPLWEYSTR